MTTGNRGALREKEALGGVGLPVQEDVSRQKRASLESGVQHEQRSPGNREDPGASTRLGIPH